MVADDSSVKVVHELRDNVIFEKKTEVEPKEENRSRSLEEDNEAKSPEEVEPKGRRPKTKRATKKNDNMKERSRRREAPKE